MSKMKDWFVRAKQWLTGLSFRTGVIVLACCVPFYIFSFAQAALPISIALKGTLWVIFFGLAKTFQYAGILILGKEGIRRIRARFKSGRTYGSENFTEDGVKKTLKRLNQRPISDAHQRL